MIDAAQPARSDEYQRIAVEGNVINGQQIAGQGHHQSPSPFQQDGIIAFAERFRRPLYLAEINRTAVYLGCQS